MKRAIFAVLLISTAGCMSFLPDQQPTEHTSISTTVEGWQIQQSGHVGKDVEFPVSVEFESVNESQEIKFQNLSVGDSFQPALQDNSKYKITVYERDGDAISVGTYIHDGENETLVVCCGS